MTRFRFKAGYMSSICSCCGRSKTNRKRISTTVMKPIFYGKSTVANKKGNTMLLTWRDKRILSLLSNWHNSRIITNKNLYRRRGTEKVIEKSNVVVGYIKSMSGADRADQYASNYCFLRKSLKWLLIYLS